MVLVHNSEIVAVAVTRGVVVTHITGDRIQILDLAVHFKHRSVNRIADCIHRSVIFEKVRLLIRWFR